ncbi:MAG: hypothetical protein L3J07_00420 [Candidatus Magasanikbacteria bacterium]|nr:hypothetical protein [Candidatus Magasanikbacteria bacterium]
MKNIEKMLSLFSKELAKKYPNPILLLSHKNLFRTFHHRFDHKVLNFFLNFLQKRGMTKESMHLCEVLGFHYPKEMTQYLFSYLFLDEKIIEDLEEMIKTGELVVCPNSSTYTKDSYKIWIRLRSEGASYIIRSLKEQLFHRISKLFFVNQNGKTKSFFLMLNSNIPLPNLRELSAPNCDLSIYGIKCILRQTSLNNLDLRNNLINDKALEKIRELSELFFLDLSENQITFRGLISLLSLSKLKQLGIRKNKFSDAIIDTISKMKYLECLDVSENPLSRNGILELKQKLPNCRIVLTPVLRIVRTKNHQ